MMMVVFRDIYGPCLYHGTSTDRAPRVCSKSSCPVTLGHKTKTSYEV
jgi:hypothetical protein